MAGLISAIARRPARIAAPVAHQALDQLQRLEQAAGFSMVAFEAEDDQPEQPVHAGLWDGEAPSGIEPSSNEAPGMAHRMASLIDECTAAVTSYLRPAVWNSHP